jgi:hypothetical protein
MGIEWLFLQQEEWYRRSMQLLSLCRDEGCFFMLSSTAELISTALNPRSILPWGRQLTNNTY